MRSRTKITTSAEPERPTTAYGVGSAGDRQFLKQRPHVGLDSVQGQHKIVSYLLIRAQLAEQPQYVAFASSQRNDEHGVVRVTRPVIDSGHSGLGNGRQEGGVSTR